MRIMNVTEWYNQEITSKPDYIDQLLPSEPGEYMLVSGRTGIGKSLLVLQMGCCLATGTDFFGFKCNKVTVGYLAMEGGRRNIKDRISKVLPQYPESDNLGFELRQPFLLAKNPDIFRSTFEDCQVVILDNLRQVTTGKYLTPEYAASWIKTYQELLRDVGAVGILTQHIKKPNEASLIYPGDVYELKGATEYVDASSTVLLLERARQGRNADNTGFGKRDNSLTRLYFAKHRVETEELPEYLPLKRSFEKASFELREE